MKKFITGLFLIISTIAIAKNDYDYVENKLELKYKVLTDSKQNNLKIDDVEIDIFNGKIYAELEVESLVSDGGWNNFNKKDYERLAKEIADDIRMMIETKDSVEIALVLDKEIGGKELLTTGMY